MRIPLTVIGGFLGAGKTTLVNRVLREAPPGTAVLVNDFGAVQIDADLIVGCDGETIALANGCVCCQIGDDLTRTLDAVLSRTPAPAWLVIEASGVSDPWRIAQIGLVDPQLTLDGVIVVVDASTVRERLADPRLADTVRRQWAGADVIVLNKVDALEAGDRAALRAWLQAELRASGCAAPPVFEAAYAAVPWAALTGVHQRWPAGPSRPNDGRAPAAAAPGHDASPGAGTRGAYLGARRPRPSVDHGLDFESASFQSATGYAADALRALHQAMPEGVLRLKAIVRTERHPCAEWQFAGRHGSLRALAPPPGWDGVSRVVAIGLRGRLPRAALSERLQAAVLPGHQGDGPPSVQAPASGSAESAALALGPPPSGT